MTGTSENSPPDPLIGHVIDSRYRIEDRIAAGGMSTVYRATDLRLDRLVAVKIMNRSLAEDADFVKRFQREAKAAARLNDPNVVGVYDQGEYDGLVFLVMEYVPGFTLRDVLRTHGALSPTRSLGVMEQILWALSAAHKAGFVHRDIKPENVLITSDGTAKVADFGLARAIAGTSNATRTQGMIIGTVGYLSPEQVESGTADERSDIYAAGVLLFEMLTGRVPYDEATPLAVAYRHVNDRVPAPSTIMEGIPAAVDDLVVRSTQVDPESRYPDIASFLTDVTDVQENLLGGDAELPDTPVIVTGQPSDAHTSTSTLTGESGTAVLPLDDATSVVTDTPQDAPAKPSSDTEDTSEETKRRRPRSRFWPIAVIVALAVIIGSIGWWGGSLRYTPAPNLVGMTVEQAQQAAGPDLKVKDASQEFSETVPKDIIIRTDPPEGVQARIGSTIDAIVSKGPERYDVPDVRGKSIDAATSDIENTKLAVGGSQSVFDDTVPDGQVASTDPAIGTPQKPGTVITLLVSKGPAPVAVPNVAGQSQADASATLQQAGLQATVQQQYDDTIPAGSAVGTAPAAGAQLKRGDPITLIISQGPPPVQVPNVVDLKSGDATSRLQAVGFVVNKQPLAGFIALDRVISQNPGAGTTAPKGSTVTITVV